MCEVAHYNITDDAIRDAKDVEFDIIFQHYGIKYSASKSYKLVDYLCPFHDHDTNTFHASKWYMDSNTCRCFACNENLDTIAFVSKYENIGFREAVVKLLEISGQADKYLRKKGEKYEKKPYQLRYLTNREKQVLGFATESRRFSLSRNCNVVVPIGSITGTSYDKPDCSSWFDFDMDAYLKVETFSLSDMWRTIMKDDPVGYRSMVLGKVSESLNRINELMSEVNTDWIKKELEEDKEVVDKVAKDFGYYRVVNYIQG